MEGSQASTQQCPRRTLAPGLCRFRTYVCPCSVSTGFLTPPSGGWSPEPQGPREGVGVYRGYGVQRGRGAYGSHSHDRWSFISPPSSP